MNVRSEGGEREKGCPCILKIPLYIGHNQWRERRRQRRRNRRENMCERTQSRRERERENERCCSVTRRQTDAAKEVNISS